MSGLRSGAAGTSGSYIWRKERLFENEKNYDHYSDHGGSAGAYYPSERRERLVRHSLLLGGAPHEEHQRLHR